MKRSIAALALLFFFLSGLLTGCAAPADDPSDKLQVVATLFPYYDMARAIGGERIEATLLLPPGRESHSFEPTPADMITVSRSDVFLYNGGEGEQWAKDVLTAAGTDIPSVLCGMEAVALMESEVVEGMEDAPHVHSHGAEPHQDDEHESAHVEYDEHIWTSPVNAMALAKAICGALTAADPAGAAFYEANLAAYLAELTALHQAFCDIRAEAKRDVLLFADRFPLLYFCETYDLQYSAAFPGCAADTEPSIATVRYLIDKTAAESIPVIFTLELSSSKIADVVAEATGASVRTFYSLQNISRADFDAGETYLSLMWKNLETVKEALS